MRLFALPVRSLELHGGLCGAPQPYVEERRTSAMSTRAAWLFVAAIAAVNVAIRIQHLGLRSLWLDEAVSVHIAQMDIVGIIRASRADTTPPLYYLALGAFERLFGISEAAVRALSVLASAATGSALFLLARRRLGTFAAWFASALFLLSDANLRYSREARPYALASFLCVISFALFLRALDRRTRGAWVAVAVANAALVFTHYTAGFVVVAQGLALVWPWRGWAAVRRFALFHAVVVALILAWTIGLLIDGQHLKMNWLPAPSLSQFGNALAWSVGGRGAGGKLAVLLVTVGTAFAMARYRRSTPPWTRLAPFALWSLAPPLLAFVALFHVRCIHPRYLLYATSGVILLWATVVDALPSRRARAFGAIAACFVSAIGFGAVLHRPADADWRSAADIAHATPAGTRILLVPPWESRTFAYYYDREAFRDAEHTLARLVSAGVHAIGEGATIGAGELGDAKDLLIVSGGRVERLGGIERQLTDQGFTVIERRELPGVALSRLARQGGR